MSVSIKVRGRRTVPSSAATRFRVVLLCALYAVLSLWALVMSSVGTVVLLLGRLPDDSWRFGALAAGAFKVMTLGGAFAVLFSRGRSVLAVRALVVGQVVWLTADLVAPQESASTLELLARFAVSMAIWVGPWLVLAHDRSRLWRDPVRLRRPVLALAVVAIVPCLVWAAATARLDASAQTSLGSQAELRFDVVGCALAVVTTLFLTSFLGARWWDRAVALTLAVVGVAALLLPHGYGSPGHLGGLLVVPAIVLACVSRSMRSLSVVATRRRP